MLHEINKVTASHLTRNAYLYIRQSSLKQLVENQESAKRQYSLRDKAMALGWPQEKIIVIDHDTGLSGADAADRKGFQQLVSEVGMGYAGIVMGLEVSRLARNSSDWHRLLEICAVTDTLLLDEDGIYNPKHFNDRLVLGLKGTMSEAELHILKARMRGGALNKARRGELAMPLPIGFVYDEGKEVILDPDQQVQESIRYLFDTFKRTGSAYLTVKEFKDKALKFPTRPLTGTGKGQLFWTKLTHSRVIKILHNPRYAGIFFYGRTHQIKQVDGKVSARAVPREQWLAFLPDSHPGYITPQQFELNERRLLQNAQCYSADRMNRPPREGCALLQGMVICGKCGKRMTLRYHYRKKGLVPDYVCQRSKITTAGEQCQYIPGRRIDEVIGDLLVEKMTPLTIEASVAVQKEIETRKKEADGLRRQNVERARYEADLARRRYMSVEPENRLVAMTLESQWNEKLKALSQAQEEYDRLREKDKAVLNEEQQTQILSLAKEFPKIWRNPQVPNRERKRMARLLIEDVTLKRHGKMISVQVRFKGGGTTTAEVPASVNYCLARKTDGQIVKEVDLLLDSYRDSEIASMLNDRLLFSGAKLLFNHNSILRIRFNYNLKSHYTRLRERGMLNRKEMLKLLDVNNEVLKALKDEGFIKTYRYSDCPSHFLYEPPNEVIRSKIQGKRFLSKELISQLKDRLTQEA